MTYNKKDILNFFKSENAHRAILYDVGDTGNIRNAKDVHIVQNNIDEISVAFLDKKSNNFISCSIDKKMFLGWFKFYRRRNILEILELDK